MNAPWIDGSSARDLNTSYKPRNTGPRVSIEYVNLPSHITSKQLDNIRIQTKRKQMLQARTISMGLSLAQRWMLVATYIILAFEWVVTLFATFINIFNAETLFSFGIVTGMMCSAILASLYYYRHLDKHINKVAFMKEEDDVYNAMLKSIFWFLVITIGLLAIVVPCVAETIAWMIQ
jgi:hypothetical protein